MTLTLAGLGCLPLDDAGNRLRFQLELEFVQCLANPNYLNCKWLSPCAPGGFEGALRRHRGSCGTRFHVHVVPRSRPRVHVRARARAE